MVKDDTTNLCQECKYSFGIKIGSPCPRDYIGGYCRKIGDYPRCGTCTISEARSCTNCGSKTRAKTEGEGCSNGCVRKSKWEPRVPAVILSTEEVVEAKKETCTICGREWGTTGYTCPECLDQRNGPDFKRNVAPPESGGQIPECPAVDVCKHVRFYKGLADEARTKADETRRLPRSDVKVGDDVKILEYDVDPDIVGKTGKVIHIQTDGLLVVKIHGFDARYCFPFPSKIEILEPSTDLPEMFTGNETRCGCGKYLGKDETVCKTCGANREDVKPIVPDWASQPETFDPPIHDRCQRCRHLSKSIAYLTFKEHPCFKKCNRFDKYSPRLSREDRKKLSKTRLKEKIKRLEKTIESRERTIDWCVKRIDDIIVDYCDHLKKIRENSVPLTSAIKTCEGIRTETAIDQVAKDGSFVQRLIFTLPRSNKTIDPKGIILFTKETVEKKEP